MTRSGAGSQAVGGSAVVIDQELERLLPGLRQPAQARAGTADTKVEVRRSGVESGGAESGGGHMSAEDYPLARDWIAIDWTPNIIRAWLIDSNGQVLDRAEVPPRAGCGTGRSVWFSLIQPWLGTETASELLIARCDGDPRFLRGADWLDIPTYTNSTRAFARVPAVDARLRAYCLPGIRSLGAQAYTRVGYVKVVGSLGLMPDFAGVVCLPGIRSHWINVENRQVIGLTSAPTGQIEQLLAVGLVAEPGCIVVGEDAEGHEPDFLAAFEETLAHPERGAIRLNQVQTSAVLEQLDPVSAGARLAGVLVGLEFAGARRNWLGQPVLLVGEDRLVRFYRAALRLIGHEATVLPESEVLPRGFSLLRELLPRD